MIKINKSKMYLLKDTRTRKKISVKNQHDAVDLVQMLSVLPDEYVLENMNGTRRVDAKSVLGVMYLTMDFVDNTWLVNESNDGVYPEGVDKFVA